MPASLLEALCRRRVTQVEERLAIGVPIAASDIGELGRGDPAEIECLLMPDVTDREGSFTT